MKFSKNLSNLIEQTLPDWRDKFLSYKDLKKQLKLIYPKSGDPSLTSSSSSTVRRPNKRPRLTDDGDAAAVEEEEAVVVVTKEVIDFVRLLEDEIDKFNAFFVDQEEEYVIRLKVLQDRVAEARDSNEELMTVGREIVDFHGEMVLLLNYSALNYTGLVKILKKYDKRSGALIRLPFIQKVLQQPFFTTDVLNQLVKECETMLDQFFSMNEQLVVAYQAAAEGKEELNAMSAEGRLQKIPEELAEIKNIESMYMKHTSTALEVLNKIRSGSSTRSMFSLPPLQGKQGRGGMEENPYNRVTS